MNIFCLETILGCKKCSETHGYKRLPEAQISFVSTDYQLFE